MKALELLGTYFFHPWCRLARLVACILLARVTVSALAVSSDGLDLREPMALAARAIPPRLDPQKGFRPWFLIRGSNGVPAALEHASWDFGDMTGRYVEGLILARHMGVCAPELSHSEERLQRYLLNLQGPDGLIQDPDKQAPDHSFSQGSALYGLLALYEDSGDPVVQAAIERLITGLLKRLHREGEVLVDETVKLEQSSGSHLAGCAIYPTIRFYELTGYPDALVLAEGLSRWALADPVIGPQGEITKPLSWEGHLHSWLDTLAGCVRTARNSRSLDLKQTVLKAKQVYDWTRKTNATAFGWIATYPTGGSSETCAISSAMRLALELAACGEYQYFDEAERFARNQLVWSQFREIRSLAKGKNAPVPLLLGCFDSQAMPDHHLGTRGGEDVGTVEGCCLNGGMRALALAWNAIAAADEKGLTINLPMNWTGPAGEVISYEPAQGRIDIILRSTSLVRLRLAPWMDRKNIQATVDKKPTALATTEWYATLAPVRAGARVTFRYVLREKTERSSVGGRPYELKWRGNTVVSIAAVTNKNERARTFMKPLQPLPAEASKSLASGSGSFWSVPDTAEFRDAARLATFSMLARMDLQREGQPFFRVYAFAKPPYAQHEKWDDGDMTGRYVEALILARKITGLPLDDRETLLRQYLLKLFDLGDGLCYTRPTPWTPRRACLFSQSSAMLGLLAWAGATQSLEARKLLDWQVDGLMGIAVERDNYALFPKYEFDGHQYVNEPAGKDAPPWYGGRLILPLVQYWQLSGREDVRLFLDKLVLYCTDVSTFIKPDGAVEGGEGWWGHLHGTMDMVAGIVEYGRLRNRPELIQWGKRVYDWIGRTHTTRYGWVADVSGGRICESCAIASRVRLGLALYRAGAVDPFGEMDRFLRNQLLENQFKDLSFMAAMKPGTPRTDEKVYEGIDRMLRGTFQCWGTANDLIGNDDVEGCGTGGGVQALALAFDSQAEWRDAAQGKGKELRVNLLFNRRIRAKPQPPFVTAAPVALELWSFLPYAGRVNMRAHEPIDMLSVRLPDGVRPSATVRRFAPKTGPAERVTPRPISAEAQARAGYVKISAVKAGEQIELQFALPEYETTEKAAGQTYKVGWKGSSVLTLNPPGKRVPLYQDRAGIRKGSAPLTSPRYP